MTDFGELINIENIEKRENFNLDRGDITFYCKNCKEIVDIDRPNKKGYIFICKKCKYDKIAIGTQEGIKEKYKIKN